MSAGVHVYATRLRWTGAAQGATTSYRAYSRDYAIEADGKPELRGSADAHFLGDATRYNPEDLLVAALCACHLLSYLAECALAGVAVVAYADDARGEMTSIDGVMRFREVVLRPNVAIADASQLEQAIALHEKAHAGCFIANSVNFPVRHEAAVTIVQPA
jgi:organic hydroperoxide reductase OsmC/OhrA